MKNIHQASGESLEMDEFPEVHLRPNEILEEEEYERLYSAPAEIIALLSLFYGGISILAVIGNSLVIWIVATTKQMRTVTNLYIANLALADVTIGLFCIPFQFQAALLQRWNLPRFMCGFCPFVQALSVNVSVFTLTAIAVDRHRAIINPLRARPRRFVSKIIIAGIWVAALIFAIPCAIAFRVELEQERVKEDGVIYNVTRPFCMNKNLSEAQLLTYRYTLVFVQYMVPFLVISFVYIQMTVKLWGTRTPGNAQDSRDLTLLRNKKKVIKMLIIVVIVFGLCWLPLQLYNILYVTIPEINEYHFISIIWFCCDWLAMSNSCYNPFIYGIYNFQTGARTHERVSSTHTRVSSIRSSYTNSSMRIRKKLFGSSNSRHSAPAAMKQPAASLNKLNQIKRNTLLLTEAQKVAYRMRAEKNECNDWQQNSFKPVKKSEDIELNAEWDFEKLLRPKVRRDSPLLEEQRRPNRPQHVQEEALNGCSPEEKTIKEPLL